MTQLMYLDGFLVLAVRMARKVNVIPEVSTRTALGVTPSEERANEFVRAGGSSALLH